jgi:hypothetical protein
VTRAELEDERSFLLASLEDLERERAAGDVSESDFATLRDRYTRRAAEVLRALGRDEKGPTEDRTPGVAVGDAEAGSQPAGPRPRRRRALAVVGSLVLLAAVAATVVETQTGDRLPGQTATGSVSLSQAAQLRRTVAQAHDLQAGGDAAGALRLYRVVLAQDPNQVEALAESGWLEFEAGVQARDGSVLTQAQQLEQRAERADPGAYVPHLYLGSMFLAEGDVPGAVGEYRQFLADGPPPDKVRTAEPFIRKAFTQAGQPVPEMPGSIPSTPSTVG